MVTSLISGGGGFIGSHLVDLLIKKGHKVIVVDNLSNGKKENVNPKAMFMKYDILNPVMKAVFIQYKPNYVFHFAANARIPECTNQPEETFETNVLGTLRLLELAKEYKVKAFVYSSSSSIYGNAPVGEMIGEDLMPNPISMYGLQKYQAEQLVTLYAKVYGVPTISLRYFNVYGTSRQRADGAYPNVFSAFMRDFKEKGKITIYGDGNQKRDFVHVFDVATANLEAAKIAQKHPGEVINIGCGKAVDINTIADKILSIQDNKKEYEITYTPARLEDPLYTCANNRKARKLLGMEKWIQLKEGMEIFKKSYEI